MNQRVHQEWNPCEVEGARSIIDYLNNYYNNDGTGHDKNKKHDIVANLQTRFPRKTMQQVTEMYDDIVAEMHMLQCPEKEYDGTNSDHGVIYTVGGLVNENFGLQEEVAMEGMGILFGLPLETMPTMEIQEEVPMVEENKVVLENKMCIHQPVLAPRAKGLWTTEEHRLFLRGLRVCGRGKWKDISKYFVTSRTPVQISSHAQKYFMRLQRKCPGSQHYTINDVELNDDNPWKMENGFNFCQALALPSFDLQTPSAPFVTLNNIV